MDLTALKKYEVKDFKTAIYIPNFLSEDEEVLLLKQIYAAPKPKWVQLSNRRLQNWGGFPHAKGMVSEPIPEWLQKMINLIDQFDLFQGKICNHVLINEYLPGQGIMPHEDGPLFYPTITTISLGSHTILNLYSSRNKANLDLHEDVNISEEEEDKKCAYDKVGSLLLERRSLLILQDEMYNKYLHGIEECKEDFIDETVCNINMTTSKSLRRA